MQKTAIVLGATGLTGGKLLDLLIADASYSKIKLFSRNSKNASSQKIEEHLMDVLQLNTAKTQFTGDVVYCCIGTTTAKTKNKTLYRAIDHGIPTTAARLAKENGISTFIVMSSMGANANSRLFYNRTKGEMERDVIHQQIKNTYILRPSLIGGKRNEFRLGEFVGKAAMTLLNPLLLGRFKKYRMIAPNTIAKAMQLLAKQKPDKQIFESDAIVEMAKP